MFQKLLTPWYRIYNEEQLRHFINLPHAERNALRFISGHFPYGIHRFVNQPVRYVTFLRNPVDRVISAYFHVKRQPSHQHHEALNRGISPADFASELEIDNRHVRHLGQYPLTEMLDRKDFWWFRYGPNQLNEEHLQIANDTLRSCCFVGFREHFNEDVLQLFNRLGFPEPSSIPMLNQKLHTQTDDRLTSEAIDVIRRVNHLDCELYDFAGKLHQDQQRITDVDAISSRRT